MALGIFIKLNIILFWTSKEDLDLWLWYLGDQYEHIDVYSDSLLVFRNYSIGIFKQLNNLLDE